MSGNTNIDIDLSVFDMIYKQEFAKLSEASREHAVAGFLPQGSDPYEDMCFALGRGMLNEKILDVLREAITIEEKKRHLDDQRRLVGGEELLSVVCVKDFMHFKKGEEYLVGGQNWEGVNVGSLFYVLEAGGMSTLLTPYATDDTRMRDSFQLVWKKKQEVGEVLKNPLNT